MTSISLIRRDDNSLVEATLQPDLQASDLGLVERSWIDERIRIQQSLLEKKVPRRHWPESLHWNWSQKSALLRLLEYTGFGIALDSRWEGVILLKMSSSFARLDPDKNKPLAYVDYVETAPWNWNLPSLEVKGTFKGVGIILLMTAIKHSYDEGFGGRIGLHSLPQAEHFYSNVIGMTPLGPDPDKQNLQYFELQQAKASNLLTEGGVL